MYIPSTRQYQAKDQSHKTFHCSVQGHYIRQVDVHILQAILFSLELGVSQVLLNLTPFPSHIHIYSNHLGQFERATT